MIFSYNNYLRKRSLKWKFNRAQIFYNLNGKKDIKKIIINLIPYTSQVHQICIISLCLLNKTLSINLGNKQLKRENLLAGIKERISKIFIEIFIEN